MKSPARKLLDKINEDKVRTWIHDMAKKMAEKAFWLFIKKDGVGQVYFIFNPGDPAKGVDPQVDVSHDDDKTPKGFQISDVKFRGNLTVDQMKTQIINGVGRLPILPAKL